MKKGLKIGLVWIISTVTVYLIFTLGNFAIWCHENQISLLKIPDNELARLDSEKIQELGDRINLVANAMEESLTEENGVYYSIAEDFDPLGYSIWIYIRGEINSITTRYITMSILLGISIAIAYMVIESKKVGIVQKFLIGYLGPMLMFPVIYMYSWTYRFWSLSETYFNTNSRKFYVGYTIIFIVTYGINYGISKKMAEKLNEVSGKNQ